MQAGTHWLMARQGHLSLVTWLAGQGARLSVEDRFGQTPLLEAIRHGHDACAALLSQRGALLFARGDDPARAAALLCDAAARHDAGLVHRLLQYGHVDADAPDYDGRRAVHVAARVEVVATLLRHGAAADVTDRWGHTPLDEARRHGRADVAALLARPAKLARAP